MDDNNNSSISSDAKMADIPEESTWTFYVEGFVYDQNYDNGHEISSFSSQYETPSLISDAASSAVKRFTNEGTLGFSHSGKNIYDEENNYYRIKKNKVSIDLEDTASSPASSPKICYIDQFMNQKQKGKMDIPEVKTNVFANKGGVFTVERQSDSTGLKKSTCD